MSLLALREHLMRVRIASLASLSQLFACDGDLLRQMLQHWVRKGCVRQFARTANCGGACQKCKPAAVEIYEWVAI